MPGVPRNRAPDDENAPVGKQNFTRKGLKAAVDTLRAKVRADLAPDEVLDMYDLRDGGYSTKEHGDVCDNPWPVDCTPIRYDAVFKCLSLVPLPITEGHLIVFFNDDARDYPFAVGHGIWFKDGRIAKVY